MAALGGLVERDLHDPHGHRDHRQAGRLIVQEQEPEASSLRWLGRVWMLFWKCGWSLFSRSVRALSWVHVSQAGEQMRKGEVSYYKVQIH